MPAYPTEHMRIPREKEYGNSVVGWRHTCGQVENEATSSALGEFVVEPLTLVFARRGICGNGCEKGVVKVSRKHNEQKRRERGDEGGGGRRVEWPNSHAGAQSGKENMVKIQYIKLRTLYTIIFYETQAEARAKRGLRTCQRASVQCRQQSTDPAQWPDDQPVETHTAHLTIEEATKPIWCASAAAARYLNQKSCERASRRLSEIDLQKELLKKLERDKSLFQCKLNAALDPIARLPLEISSEIFLQTLPSTPETPTPHNVPMLLLNVCNVWNHIAMSTPALWAAICVVCPCAKSSEEALRAWLERAGNLPVSVLLRGYLHDGEFPAFIWEYGKRLKCLEICKDEYFGTDPAYDIEVSDLDIIGTQSPGRMPLLETLTIRGRGSHAEAGEFSGRQILQLLDLAPNLIECIFQDMCNISQDNIKAQWPFQLCLSDSALGDFLLFLKRSSPPLKELALGAGFSAVSNTFHECLQLVPTLECFEVLEARSHILGELFTALAIPSLVPDLHTLRTVNLFKSYPNTDSDWEAFLRMLSSRPKLRVVHVERAPGEGGFSISANILAASRDLGPDGLQIYIGSDGRKNLIDSEDDSSEVESYEEDFEDFEDYSSDEDDNTENVA
ncbi:hypothetical protein DFH06DRAFT_1289887 [Mycena polygramma]|nr:hypothetical protein DFH06DRAFT_1289887 [Mycena polygramma]